MNGLISNCYFALQTFLVREEGQDLVEYALVVALIAFGAITGMGFLATGINAAFSGVSSRSKSAQINADRTVQNQQNTFLNSVASLTIVGLI